MESYEIVDRVIAGVFHLWWLILGTSFVRAIWFALHKSSSPQKDSADWWKNEGGAENS